MSYTPVRECEFHSTYKSYNIYKVTQENGRVTYDIYEPDGSPDDRNSLVDFAFETLLVAKATITYALPPRP